MCDLKVFFPGVRRCQVGCPLRPQVLWGGEGQKTRSCLLQSWTNEEGMARMWSYTLRTCTATRPHPPTQSHSHARTQASTPTALPDTPNTLTCTHPHTNPRQQMGRSGNWLNLFPMSGSALAAPSDRKAGWACTAKPSAPHPLPLCGCPRAGSQSGLWSSWLL